MIYKRGDIVLVPFPFADLSATKTRPAVVVSSQIYHQTEPDIIIAAITSQVQHRGNTDTFLNDWQSAGLLKPSLVKASLATLEPSTVKHKLGKLSSTDLAALDHNLIVALDLKP